MDSPEYLRSLLVFLSTAGASVLAYWLVNRLPAVIEARLRKGDKTLLAVALTFVIADLAWAAQIPFGWQISPGAGWQAWAVALFAVGGPASGLNQVIYRYLNPEGSPVPPVPTA